MGIVGVGIDLVSIPDFAEQVDQPGTVFAETFTPGERRDAADKSSSAARQLEGSVGGALKTAPRAPALPCAEDSSWSSAFAPTLPM
jgi:hypothetical protein